MNLGEIIENDLWASIYVTAKRQNPTGQIRIIPKPEFFGDFGEVPLLNHHLKGDYSAGNVVIISPEP